MKTSAFAGIQVLALLIAAPTRGQKTQVLPPALDGSYGETSIPLSGRMQQIYHEGHFWDSGAFGPEIAIQEIRFRVDESVLSSTAAVLPSIRLYLSTSETLFGEFSTTDPAANSGADRRLVFEAQNATLQVSKPSSPNDFNLRFPLAQPFPLTLFGHHLVLDIEAGSTSGTVPLDVTTRTSALLLSPSGAIDMGTIASQIVFSSVPEPTTSVIGIVGGTLLLLGSRFVRKREIANRSLNWTSSPFPEAK